MPNGIVAFMFLIGYGMSKQTKETFQFVYSFIEYLDTNDVEDRDTFLDTIQNLAIKELRQCQK